VSSFFRAVNLLSSQFIFGRSLPCVQQHQAMCCFNHNRFFWVQHLCI
jgi:hypothetical protein